MRERLVSVEVLRGIAALCVVFFHFSIAFDTFPSEHHIRDVSEYGWIGVTIFFAISGFIVPYALDRRNYRIGRMSLEFLVRRIFRLEPAYLASIFGFLVISWTAAQTPWADGSYAMPSLEQVASHFAYMTMWMGQDWLVVVYWTLAIEFQYYIVMMVCAAFILSRDRRVIYAFLLSFLSLFFVPGIETKLVFFHWVPFFTAGFAVFLWSSRRISAAEATLAVAAITAFTAALISLPDALALAFACAFIALPIRSAPAYLVWLGSISYSLYLWHQIIGRRLIGYIVKFMPRTSSVWVDIAGLAIAIGATVIVAWLSYRFIEKPGMALGQKAIAHLNRSKFIDHADDRVEFAR